MKKQFQNIYKRVFPPAIVLKHSFIFHNMVFTLKASCVFHKLTVKTKTSDTSCSKDGLIQPDRVDA